MVRHIVLASLFVLFCSCGNEAIDEGKTSPIPSNNSVEKEKLSASEVVGETLISAIANQDEILVKHAILSGADANYLSASGKTPLTLAAKYGFTKITLILIQNGAKLNQDNWHGQFPITEAASNNHRSLLRILVQFGANINQFDKNGQSPLSISLKSKNYLLANTIINLGGDIDIIDDHGNSAIDLAIRENITDAIPLLKDVSRVKIFGLQVEHLREIITEKRMTSFKYILKNIEFSDQIKNSNIVFEVLNIETSYYRNSFLNSLVRNGFNIDGDNGSNIPIIQAVSLGDFDSVKVLIKAGALINKINISRRSAITYAISDLSPTMVKILFEGNAKRFYEVDPNRRSVFDACDFLPNLGGFLLRRNEQKLEKKREIKRILDC